VLAQNRRLWVRLRLGNGFNLGNTGVHCGRWLQASRDHRRSWWS
jgi:hypothetical protein